MSSEELYLGTDDSHDIKQYGVKRRSGRYPWGSGDDPYQHQSDFLARVEERQKAGLSEREIAKEFGISTTDLRLEVKVAKHARKDMKRATAERLMEKGNEENGWKPMNVSEVARAMGYKNESSVRALLNDQVKANRDKAKTTADILMKEVESKKAIDVGAGVELELGISKPKMDEALRLCEMNGYVVQGISVPQPNNKSMRTTVMALTKPDIEQKMLYDNPEMIKSLKDYHSRDSGETFDKLQYPASIDHNRVAINYGDQGGTASDGSIFIRRGVADLDLGASNYAQVRILVDGTHYLKGMAMYSDNVPEGKDILFNTNKNSSKEWNQVLKEIKQDDPDNPFGAAIKANGQSFYIGKDGKEHLSAINKLKEEGDWESQSKTLSSQFLSKQPKDLIARQLDYTYKQYVSEFDDICKLENPTVKKKLLLDFADQIDGATVHLKAASFPRQKVQVILPIPGMKDDEIYAPNYNNGDKVALIRYPHAGLFEIPILTVNNKASAANGIMDGSFKDAVGINPKTAERLSGADFDGDTVTVIPFSDKVVIRNAKTLKALEGFDAKAEYAERPGMKLMPKKSIGKEMGMVSNLITDMTLQGADPETEISRAVKHSMVVIDAYKHRLDYKRSEQENGIAELRAKYQPKYDDEGNLTGKGGGASTLLSRRKQDIDVPERKGSPYIDKETGELVYKTSGRKYYDKKGNLVEAKTGSKLLLETPDLHTLSSGTVQEELYADYGNKLKGLANEVRKTYANTKGLTYSPEAYKTYRPEVDRLTAALNEAAKNAPRERQAQILANSRIKAMVTPDMDKEDVKKLSSRQLTKARADVGASGKATRISISEREWEAVQKGAISDTKLTQILRYADQDQVRELSMPKQTNALSPAKQSLISSMRSSGYTIGEISERLGVSSTTVNKYL